MNLSEQTRTAVKTP